MIQVNEVWVDGKLLDTFIASRVPREIRRLQKLKGVQVKIYQFREGTFTEWEENNE